jgi:hypothetical protein
MELSARFGQVSSGSVVQIPTLKEGTYYHIRRAQLQEAMYGPSVLLTLRDIDAHADIKVFLPRRYALVFSDEDIERINAVDMGPFHLLYHGPYPGSKAFKLTLEVSYPRPG